MNKKVKRTDVLKESFWSPMNIVEEVDESTGESRMRVTGVVQEADTVNQNKRIYPRVVMQEAVDNIRPKCAARRVFGEVDHPFFSGSLRDTAHLVTDLWWSPENDRQLMGEMLVLNTPTGLVLKEILRAGGRPGFSSRGHGDATEVEIDGVGKVTKISPGFRFESFDFVMDPSVKNAQITKVMEQLEIPGDKNEEELNDMDKDEKVETPETKTDDETKELSVEKPEEKEVTVEKVEEKKPEPEIIDTDDEDEGEDEEEGDEEEEVNPLRAELNELIEKQSKGSATIESILGALKGGGFIVEPKVAETAELNATIESLTVKLAAVEEALASKSAEIEALHETTRKVAIEAYISQKVAGHQFEIVLKKRLTEAEPKTKEEVDAALGGYAELIEAFNGQEEVFGKGRGKKTTEQDKATESSAIKDSIKQKAGIRPKEAK